MKLVTGIEAIQSGKPWKHHRDEAWFEPDSDSPLFTQVYLRLKQFIIKEEPREFWIFINNKDDTLTAKHGYMKPVDPCNWIRVREIEK